MEKIKPQIQAENCVEYMAAILVPLQKLYLEIRWNRLQIVDSISSTMFIITKKRIILVTQGLDKIELLWVKPH